MQHQKKINIILIGILIVSFVSIILSSYIIFNNAKNSNSERLNKYYGPVPEGYDLETYRKIGETRLNNINNEYDEEIAYVLTEIGCLKTADTIKDFNNRQMLMYNMNLPVYLRCE